MHVLLGLSCYFSTSLFGLSSQLDDDVEFYFPGVSYTKNEMEKVVLTPVHFTGSQSNINSVLENSHACLLNHSGGSTLIINYWDVNELFVGKHWLYNLCK